MTVERSRLRAEATPKRAMEGKAEVIYDFSGTDEQELTVFAGQQV